MHKRSRASEWPLKNTRKEDKIKTGKSWTPQRLLSPHQRSPTTRPSKFVEGSMNDRISAKPPSLYMREDEAMNQYMTTPIGGPTRIQRQSFQSRDSEVFYDAGINSQKPSGMYRFGKAIANAFNPVTVWQGINGIWREKEEQRSVEKAIMHERQARAEKAYAELKKSGYKGTRAAPIPRASAEKPIIQGDSVAEGSQSTSFRDSGVDMDGYRSSAEHRTDGHAIDDHPGLMPPPPLPGSDRSASPMSAPSAGRRSSLNLPKPSFPNLKRVTSHLQLPSTRRQSALSTPLPSMESEVLTNLEVTEPELRKQPSRKELAKQQKLTKRVSDLEIQLEKARRELNNSFNGAEPHSKLGLKPFKPGNLPSLPSQRVLRSHEGSGNQDEESEAETEISHPRTTGRGVTKELASNENQTLTPPVDAQIENELRNSVSSNSPSRKRKSEHDTHDDGKNKRSSSKGANPLSTDGSDGNLIAKPESRRRSGRARKSPKGEESAVTDSVTAVKGPRKSRKRNDDVPPLPKSSVVFDPSTIDQGRILSMRSVSNSKLPFGQVSEDIINLRALYPFMTEVQLVHYIDGLPKDKQGMDHTSLSHHDQPVSPVLGPPISASPVKITTRKPKRGISPPPPSLISPKRPLLESKTLDEAEMADVITVESKKFESILDSKKTAQKTKERPKAASVDSDKPLPTIQKEDYEWPEDVF